MKKIKLITSLCSIGVLVTTTPIVVTSCSNNGLTIELSKDEVYSHISQTIEILLTYAGNPIEAKEINNIETSDPSILEIANPQVSKSGNATFDVIGQKKDNSATITVNITDCEGHTSEANFEIRVVENDLPTMEITSKSDIAYWNKWDDTFYMSMLSTKADNIYVSFEGSTATTEYIFKDDNGDIVDPSLASIARGGAITFSKNVLKDANEHLHWSIWSGDIRFLITIRYKYDSISKTNQSVFLPKQTPEVSVEVGKIGMLTNGKQSYDRYIFKSVLIDRIDNNYTGLSKDDFLIEWNDDYAVFSIMTKIDVDWSNKWLPLSGGELIVQFTTKDNAIFDADSIIIRTDFS